MIAGRLLDIVLIMTLWAVGIENTDVKSALTWERILKRNIVSRQETIIKIKIKAFIVLKT